MGILMPTHTVQEMTEIISRFVNSADHAELRELGDAMAHDHRTLVQNKMRVFASFVATLAQQEQDGFYDCRNEASVKWAAKIAQDGQPFLPFV
jgi:hypothetical protein